MNVKFQIQEQIRGRLYNGTITGTETIIWVLACIIPLDNIEKEISDREKAGKPAKGPECFNELFLLSLINQKTACHIRIEDVEIHEAWMQLICEEVETFYKAPISDMWSQITAGQMASPFEVGSDFEIGDEMWPKTG